MARYLPEGCSPTALAGARRVRRDPSCRSRAFRKSFMQIKGSKRRFSGFWARYLHERPFDVPISAREIAPKVLMTRYLPEGSSPTALAGARRVRRDPSCRSGAFRKSFVQIKGSKRRFSGFWARYLHERLFDGPLSAREIAPAVLMAPYLPEGSSPTTPVRRPSARQIGSGLLTPLETSRDLPAEAEPVPAAGAGGYCVTRGISPAGRPRGQQRHRFRPSTLPARPAALRNRRSAGTAPGRPRCCGPPACRQC
jgi:hypothetical protein